MVEWVMFNKGREAEMSEVDGRLLIDRMDAFMVARLDRL